MNENKMICIVMSLFITLMIALGVARILSDGSTTREAMRAGLEQVTDSHGNIVWQKKEAK